MSNISEFHPLGVRVLIKYQMINDKFGQIIIPDNKIRDCLSLNFHTQSGKYLCIAPTLSSRRYFPYCVLEKKIQASFWLGVNPKSRIQLQIFSQFFCL